MEKEKTFQIESPIRSANFHLKVFVSLADFDLPQHIKFSQLPCFSQFLWAAYSPNCLY